MEFDAYNLKFKSFHIGEDGRLDSSSAFIHSDTIFSGVCNVWARAYGKEDLDSMLKEFHEDPPFVISSAFPYIDDVYYFPKPFLVATAEVPEDKRKDFKKMAFFSKEFFERYIDGNLSNEEMAAELEKSSAKILEENYLPKVALDRVNSSSEPFSFSENRLHKNAGYFFLYRCRKEYIDKFKNAILILSDEGIGGKKTWGCGQFEAESSKIDLELPEGNMYCSLSLYYPKEDERLSDKCSYNLLERGGWIVSQTPTKMKRKSVYMLSEGSLFDFDAKGKLVDVTPNGFDLHNVYRCGLAFTIPVVKR